MVQWLRWAIPEFSLEGFNINQFAMHGSKLCRMSEEEFLSRTPPFMGDILWAHLEILRRGIKHTNHIIILFIKDKLSISILIYSTMGFEDRKK